MTLAAGRMSSVALPSRVQRQSEKGFGFIAPDDGSADLFAHYSAINSGGYRSLEENQKVSFEAEQGPKGMQATNIQVL